MTPQLFNSAADLQQALGLMPRGAYTPPPPVAAPSYSPMDSYTGDEFNSPDLTSAATNYNTAQTQSINDQAGAYNLPALLKSALDQKFGQVNSNDASGSDNPYIKNLKNKQEAYTSSVDNQQSGLLPKDNNGVVLSPSTQQNLINSKVGGNLAGLQIANLLYGLEGSGIPDSLNAATGAANANATRSQGAAELAGKQYTNILDMIKARVSSALQHESNVTGQQQVGVEQQANINQATYNKVLGDIAQQQRDLAKQQFNASLPGLLTNLFGGGNSQPAGESDNTMVTIKNNKTGQTMTIPRSNLGQYGL